MDWLAWERCIGETIQLMVIVNHDTMGMVPMDLFLVRLDDRGASWSEPQVIAPPLKGPAFEICHVLGRKLPDGRWLALTATWAG